MSDEVYERAVQRLDELDRETKELQIFINLYRQTRQRLGLDVSSEARARTTQEQSRLEFDAASQQGATPGRVVDNPKPAVVVDAVLEILETQGRPMSPKQLHTALTARGLIVRGAQPVKTLATNLWRAKDRIVALEKFGYWAKDKAYGPAGYFPASVIAEAAAIMPAPENHNTFS
jgi:hypothetical protein